MPAEEQHITEERRPRATRTCHRISRLAAPIAAFLLGAAALAGAQALIGGNETDPAAQPSEQPGLAGEAYSGCLLLGMSEAEIEADRDQCLVTYWTPKRLRLSDQTRLDWERENGIAKDCHDGLCNLDAGEPLLPPDDDPWWAEQAVRYPNRQSRIVPIH